LCSKINRAAGSGILFGSGFIDSPTENLGSIQTTGLDVDANYRLDLGDMDMDGNILTFNLVGTRVFTHEATPLPGGATYDCVGLYGPTCGVTVGSASPVAEWRHKLRATWGTPWDMNISLAWRYISETKYEGNSPDPSLNVGVNNTADAVIRAYDYFDLAVDWFVGSNDLGAQMWDDATRGGYDGLTSLGPNLNEGAESTLALITTMQYAVSRSAARTPAPALFNASAG
jgi:hypothetical protein